MRLKQILSLIPLGSTFAFPQDPAKGVGSSGAAGGIGSLLSGMFGGAGSLSSAMPGAGDDISATICKTFEPGNPTGKLIESIFGSPNGPGPDEKCVKDDSGGSGPYKANYTEDSTLPGHTLYVPKTPPPASEKLPVIVWGNGACLGIGTMFVNFLNELASYGFLIIANGKSTNATLSGETYKDLITSIDWVVKNPATKKYGNIDTTKLVVAGQSCGGLEAYQATLADPRIKMTVLFNSGYLSGSNAQMMAKFKNPIAYFLGGPKDMAQANGAADYKLLPASATALKLDIDVGHMGSYYQKGGGKMGKAAIAFFKWQLKGDASQKPLFCSPAADSILVKLGFRIESKGALC